MSVDLSIFVQNTCARIRPEDESWDACVNIKEMVSKPQELKAAMDSQIKFLRENAKPTGREVVRSIDGGSLNVIDARDGDGAGGHNMSAMDFGHLSQPGSFALGPADAFIPIRRMQRR